MTRVSLQTVCLCALLLLTERAAARQSQCRGADYVRGGAHGIHVADGEQECVNEKQLQRREDRLLRRYRGRAVAPQVQATRTCDQVMQDARNCERAVEKMLKDPQKRHDKSLRSLSPWEFCIHRDDNRVPHEISVAMCLCQGCIIDRHEDASYNSVPVCGQMMVQWRTQCKNDTNKYVVKREVISIPVACTCVRPVYSE
ncbi:uncharacterized protein PAE49_023172 [Odontesthes bonariensis]